MTVTYQHGVASGSFRGFTKLLLKWHGSVYKLVYKELLCFIIGYIAVRIMYQYALDTGHKRTFELLTLYCAEYIDLIPLAFVLGFYVTFVVQRWWTQFISIPFPDKIMNTIVTYIDGTDEKSRILRRTLMRYLNLSFVLMMMSISTAVKKRFPNLRHLVKSGYMTDKEYEIYSSIRVSINTFWLPFNWFLALLAEARRDGQIKDNVAMKHIVEELNEFRDKLKLLWCHDWVTLPLVYTQVVTWATHLYFLISLIARQYLDPKKGYKGHEVDYYVPFFTLIQFMFYMGWLKVAEELINPFGDDDDDIECNWLIDRHIQVSYIGVDELFKNLPTLSNSDYWAEQHVENLGPTIQHPNDLSACTMHLKKSRKKCPFMFSHCCRWPKKENPSTPTMVGKKNKLFCEEALALINAGQWRFSQDQNQQIRNNSRISTLDGRGSKRCSTVQNETYKQIMEGQETPKINNQLSVPQCVLHVPALLPQRRNTFHADSNSSATRSLKDSRSERTDSVKISSLPASTNNLGPKGHTYKDKEQGYKSNLSRFSKVEDLKNLASVSSENANLAENISAPIYKSTL